MINAAGRETPSELAGRKLKPYRGPFSTRPSGRRKAPRIKFHDPRKSKVLKSIREAIKKVGLKDGDTISFHHHLRNGDHVVNMVLDTIARMGIKDIRLAPTALFPVHEKVIQHIKNGVVTRIEGSMNGPVGAFVSEGGKLKEPAILRSHGGRARAVASGELDIDVAFIAAPICDDYGNCNGRYGKSAFGAMGYAYTDTVYAEHTVVITDNIQPYPVTPPIVQQTFVDYIVKVNSIGDPSGIQTGTLRITRSPARLKIAREAVNVLAAAGILRNGVSIQAGAGGISLAATKFVHEYMKKHGIVGSFVMGGTTKYVVDMLREGTMMKILDVQSFDLAAIESLRTNPMHVEINNTFYADIHSGGCAVDKLDAAFLGGTEIDINFNVNVNTHSDGKLLHGIGGHQDVAAGADITMILMPTIRGRIPTIRKEVTTITTPGETVDVLVTERGIAVNPRREDLIEDLKGKVPLVDIEDLYKRVRRFCREPKEPKLGDEIVAVIEYRDGTVIDVVRAVKS